VSRGAVLCCSHVLMLWYGGSLCVKRSSKYDGEIATALQKGIIDAFGGAGERVVVIPPIICCYSLFITRPVDSMFTLINTGMYTINSYLDLGAGVSLVGGWGGVGHKRHGVGGVHLTLQPANGCILPLYSGVDPVVRRAIVY